MRRKERQREREGTEEIKGRGERICPLVGFCLRWEEKVVIGENAQWIVLDSCGVHHDGVGDTATENMVCNTRVFSLSCTCLRFILSSDHRVLTNSIHLLGVGWDTLGKPFLLGFVYSVYKLWTYGGSQCWKFFLSCLGENKEQRMKSRVF